MVREHAVPTFYLYGEPHQAVDADFLHVERLADRSRPSEWTIRPHSHADLDQLFVVETGGGIMTADAARIPFAAPAMLLVPAGVVHGFEWASESVGWVLTLSRAHVEAIGRRHEETRRVFRAAASLAMSAVEVPSMLIAMESLSREAAWRAPARPVAIEGLLLGLFVTALRLIPNALLPDGQAGRAASLVARFRQRIEDRHRLREPVATFAAALGVSEKRLRSACVSVAGKPPAAMIDERSLLEARRALSYSNLSIAEVGYALGFADPAYFSRFFSRHAGCTPREYRRKA